MPAFDVTKGQFLDFQHVALTLKVSLPYLNTLILDGRFPAADKTVNGVQYWNNRTVQTWLGVQPTK